MTDQLSVLNNKALNAIRNWQRIRTNDKMGHHHGHRHGSYWELRDRVNMRLGRGVDTAYVNKIKLK